MEPALNHTSLRLLCSWPGGFPSPSLWWTGDPILPGRDDLQTNAAILLLGEGLTTNNSLFKCMGSHQALKEATACSVRTCESIFLKRTFYSSELPYVTRLSPDVPPAEPVCFAYVTNNQQYLMLSCSWDGGAPKALVWWEGPGGQSKGGEENSNILILRYGTAHSGLPYTCHAKHPLLVQTKTCRLTLGQYPLLHALLKACVLLIHSFPLLEAPVLLTQRRVVSVYEGDDVQLTCNLRASYLPANEITWFNNQGMDVHGTTKYTVLRTSAWANLTVRDVHETLDSGEYRCSTANAVGGTEINITLHVKSKVIVNQKTSHGAQSF